MPTTSKKGRSRVALLAVVAMLTTLVAFAAPAGALVSDACPANTPSAGFTDLGGVPADAVDAIDCIRMYGITTGTSATTYSPYLAVDRWEMALFLTRTAQDMGITLPDGSDQGFTDLAGVPSAAVTAINQLAQLGITTGTTATTFSPFTDVERWQMALFLVRLVQEAGVFVSANPPSAGFNDLTGVPESAVTAINQLVNLGIAQGTSSTTFSPFTSVERWAMALFLARSLDVADVTPPGQLSVTPNTAQTTELTGATASRQYTISASGATSVTIELWSADDINASNQFTDPDADAQADADITVVNGVGTSGDKVTGVDVTDGSATFTVTATDATAVVPVVYVGTTVTGLTGASASAPKTATNASIGFGGAFIVIIEAGGGAFAAVPVDSVDKDGDSFVGAGETYFYDSNDQFRIGGVPVTMANFEANLSTGDEVSGTYAADASLQSTFDLNDLAPVAPTVTYVSETSNSAKFTYTADAGASSVRVYRCQGTAAACTSTSLVAEVAAGSDADTALAGNQLVAAGLQANTTYTFQFTQVVDGEESAKTGEIEVTTDAAPSALSIQSVTVNSVNDGAGTWTELIVEFDKTVDAVLAIGNVVISPTTQPGLQIAATAPVDGDIADTDTITFTFPAQNDVTPDLSWTLTVKEGALDIETGAGVSQNAQATATFSH